MNQIAELFSSDGFMPHGFCYQWKPTLILIHSVSDILIAIAYVSIPLALLYLVRKRRNFPFDWMFVGFGIFVAACGITHLMEVVTLGIPVYWISGGVKAITGLVSLPTAILLARVVPQVLQMPTAKEMQVADGEPKNQAAVLSEHAALQGLCQGAILVQTIDGRNLQWNQDAERMYGWAREEAIGRINHDLLGTTFPEPRDEIIEKLLAEGYWEGELQKRRRGGQSITVSSHWALGRSLDGSTQRILVIDTDITERQQAEEALRESENHYRDLVEHSHDLICTHDLQGRLLSVNEPSARTLGYSRAEMLERTMGEFLPETLRPQFDEYLSKIKREGSAQGLFVVLTKSGKKRIWEYSNSLRTEGVSEPIVRGIARDVTEQRHAERALRLSEEKFSKAFQASPYAIIISTIDEGRFIDVNDSFLRIMGLTREQTIGHTSLELGLWTNLDDRIEMLEEIKKSGHVKSKQIVCRASDGRHVIGNVSAETIEVGGQECLLVVCEDITGHKQAEEARRQSEELLRAAFAQVGVGFSMIDRQGRLLKVNEAFCRITSYSEDELLRMDFESITHPEDLAANLEQMKRLIAGETNSVVYQKRYIRKSGERVWVQNSVSAVRDGEGQVYGFMALTEDITERKRAEDELRKLSGRLLQLQDEERRKIARDLHDSTGQDLAALSNTLGHLHVTIPAVSRKLRKSISQCQAVADRCIREIRTLSYLLHPPMLDEAGLEDAIRNYAEGFAVRTGIEVELEVSPKFGRMPRETETALFRVIQESLVNIHRHSGSFSARIRLGRAPAVVLLEVSDKGRGIPATENGRNKVHPFAAGVGIQSMRERMKQIGAKLEIQSGAEGTTVRATVPAHD